MSTPTPAPRADDIGRLAALLIGDFDAPPDLTAAVPLSDALREGGLPDWDMCLRATLGEMYAEWFPHGGGGDDEKIERSGPPLTLLPQLVRERLRARLGVLTYDFASLAGCMAAQLEPRTTEATTTELATLKIDLQPGVEVGHRLPLPNGRMGLVVSTDAVRRVAHVVALEENGGDGAAQSSGVMSTRRRFR